MKHYEIYPKANNQDAWFSDKEVVVLYFDDSNFPFNITKSPCNKDKHNKPFVCMTRWMCNGTVIDPEELRNEQKMKEYIDSLIPELKKEGCEYFLCFCLLKVTEPYERYETAGRFADSWRD